MQAQDNPETRQNELAGAFALIKFGRNRGHLDSLVQGHIHCRTAEYYRECEADGKGDPHESAVLALRPGRGLEDWELQIAGHTLGGVTSLTGWSGSLRDQWLHCWTILRLPGNDQELDAMVRNLNRLRGDFGPHYVVISAESIPEVLARLASAAPEGAQLREVRYDDLGGSPTCKKKRFAYQSEARFLLGDCPQDKEAVLEFEVQGGMADIMVTNPVIQIVHRRSKRTLFRLDNNGAVGDADAAKPVKA